MTAQLFAFPDNQPKKRKHPKANSYTEEFETKIWGPYPRKINCSKFEAFKAWQRLPPDSQSQAIAAMPTFARSCVGKDEHYIPHCATWLNQRRFETVQIAVQPQTEVEIDWPTVLKIYAKTNNWNHAFGPEPGSPDFKGPMG